VSEIKTSRKFKRYCNDRNVLCWKTNIDGITGVPDSLIIGNGFSWWIEWKSPGFFPSDKQKYTHRKLRDRGQDVYTYNNFEDAKYTLDLYLAGDSPTYTVNNKGMTEIIV